MSDFLIDIDSYIISGYSLKSAIIRAYINAVGLKSWLKMSKPVKIDRINYFVISYEKYML